ncbi:uncharacterized protein LOC126576508 [Anopheles aquasalis]|uniref:uncharacterized protein LOC126576508 n=1 Tax=Anopheles aquasalis TaxID=42839 RepID=UPI00215A48EB|nr:uncharacterized protein LOC126576508 [Anopheles aquasalis]
MAKLVSITVCALVVLGMMVGSGWSLICRNCFSTESFAKCELMGLPVNCTAQLVNENHARFFPDNPTLVPGNETEFRCFRINGWRKGVNGTDIGLRGFGQGCTFNSTDFCSGWSGTLNITGCATCTKDNCDQEPNIPTVGPPVTAVPTNPSTGATQATTTKKPSNGATGLQQQMQLGAVILVLLNIILGSRN